MTTKYARLSPLDGSYTHFDSLEAAIDAAFIEAWNFYMSHTHGQPLSKVVVADDGSETWTTLEGESLPSPKEIEARTQRFRNLADSLRDAAQMQVTTLGGD